MYVCSDAASSIDIILMTSFESRDYLHQRIKVIIVNAQRISITYFDSYLCPPDHFLASPTNPAAIYQLF